MRLARENRWLIGPILVIGVFAAALSLACADRAHFPLFGTTARACVAMTHGSAMSAATFPESRPVLTLGLAALGAGLALSVFAPASIMRVVPVSAAAGPPPDPLNGRLRI